MTQSKCKNSFVDIEAHLYQQEGKQMRPKSLIIPALLLAGAGLSTVPTSAARAQSAPSRPTVVSAAKVQSAPPRPTVTTQVEPGVVPMKKINDRIKDPIKRKKFENDDRVKYGIAENILSDVGHKRKKDSQSSAPGLTK